MIYSKPALSLTEQLEKLKARGLIIDDESKAVHYLSNISYYRLRAYTYPFQDNDDPDHPFVQPISFEEIINLYVFDRRLRLLVFNAIEKIEIALRTKIIYDYSLHYGSHWFLNKDLFHNSVFFQANTKNLKKEIARSTEVFIAHYRNTYSTPEIPPAWMSLEVISMGLLGKILSNLKRGDAKDNLAVSFGLVKAEHLTSWVHALVNLRNICAHHGRLWNRRLSITPLIPYNTLYPFMKNIEIYENKLFAQLCCINYLLRVISPGSNFVADLKSLLQFCPLADGQDMGFTDNWQEEEIWN